MKEARYSILFAMTIAALLTSGCAKKKAAAVTPAPPPSAQAARAPERTPPAQARAAEPVARTTAPAPSRYPDAATRTRIDQLLAKIEDAYFDYNRHTLRADAIEALRKDSTELRDILKNYPDYKLTIEGHCDERGSAEYNLALGDARAKAAKEYLVQVGIPDGQLAVMSYGKEKPVCSEQSESCWQKNRRIHIVASAR